MTEFRVHIYDTEKIYHSLLRVAEKISLEEKGLERNIFHEDEIGLLTLAVYNSIRYMEDPDQIIQKFPLITYSDVGTPKEFLALLPSGLAMPNGWDGNLQNKLTGLFNELRKVGDFCLTKEGILGIQYISSYSLSEVGKRAYAKAAHFLDRLTESKSGAHAQEDKEKRSMVATINSSLDELAGIVSMFPKRYDDYLIIVSKAFNPGRKKKIFGFNINIESEEDKTATLDSPKKTRNNTNIMQEETDTVTRPIKRAQKKRKKIGGRYEPMSKVDMMNFAERMLAFAELDVGKVKEKLNDVVIGQEEPIDSLCDILSQLALSTYDPTRPQSFLMVGPTGVGKNYVIENLRAILEEEFGVMIPYALFDAPDFVHQEDISRLLGASQGHVRSEEDGRLTQFYWDVWDKILAFQVVDEIDKMHPEAMNIYLPITDRGTITDNKNNLLSFRNNFMFFTSNYGYSEIRGKKQHSIGIHHFENEEEREEIEDRKRQDIILQTIRRAIKPEFLNRVQLIHFNYLSRDDALKIFDLEFDKYKSRYQYFHNLTVIADDTLRSHIVDTHYSREFGARNIKNVIGTQVNSRLSEFLLAKRETKNATSPDSGDFSKQLATIREMKSRQDFDATDQIIKLAKDKTSIFDKETTLHLGYDGKSITFDYV